MKKKSDKKTIIILLAVLAVAAIGSGIWIYKTLKPLDIEQTELSNIQIDYVFKVKSDAISNINDFLDVDFFPGTIWENFYANDQFNRLQDIEINIDIEKDIGNPSPFVINTSTGDGVED
ncbi:MAG: hypothetical protein HOC78_03895 [Candidatus Komeilibacteria bacterium]|jgi:hypothetical protein|nr:hypothetical protein [Candidatus Komeilibacteria bacterium]